eukprot:jgi/Ulvmu1/11094/UM070_0009.1
MLSGPRPWRAYAAPAPRIRACMCRVAQPGSSSALSEGSKNCAPVSPPVGVDQVAASEAPSAMPQSAMSDVDVATSISTESSADDSAAERIALKLKILNAVAGTDRGASAALVRHRQVARLTEDLSAMNPTQDAFMDPQAGMDGAWELVYTTAETFRSSPFFWAFAEGLIRDRDMASAIFAFTDSIPGAYIGRAVQEIDIAAGSLVSRVNMTVFPAITGCVVTTSNITGFGTDFEVTVQDTRVDNSVFSPLLDNVVVPVREMFERVRGVGSTVVDATVLYLDDDFRIVQTIDDQVFMYTRMM